MIYQLSITLCGSISRLLMLINTTTPFQHHFLFLDTNDKGIMHSHNHTCYLFSNDTNDKGLNSKILQVTDNISGYSPSYIFDLQYMPEKTQKISSFRELKTKYFENNRGLAKNMGINKLKVVYDGLNLSTFTCKDSFLLA